MQVDVEEWLHMRMPEDTAEVLGRPHRSDPGSSDHGCSTLMPMEAAVLCSASSSVTG